MNCVYRKVTARKIISFMLVICLIWMPGIKAYAEEGAPVTIAAPSAILLEASTGTVIYEQNAGRCLFSGQHYQNHDAAADF